MPETLQEKQLRLYDSYGSRVLTLFNEGFSGDQLLDQLRIEFPDEPWDSRGLYLILGKFVAEVRNRYSDLGRSSA